MVIRLWVYYLYSCLPNCRKAVGLSGGKAEEAGNDLSSELVLMVDGTDKNTCDPALL